MGERKQPEAGRELSLQPPGQLPTVAGNLGGMTDPVMPNTGPGVQPPSHPTVQPFNSPSGALGPPVVQLPPSTEGAFAPPVIDRPVAASVSPPVHMVPEVQPPEKPTVGNPFQPSVKDHRAIEYDPSYWSQPWPSRMS